MDLLSKRVNGLDRHFIAMSRYVYRSKRTAVKDRCKRTTPRRTTIAVASQDSGADARPTPYSSSQFSVCVSPWA